MNKKTNLAVLLLVGFLLPGLALAVNFSNPATDFLIDLSKMGRDNTFEGLLYFFINLLLGIVGLLAILFIILGGFQYITSRGNEELADAGKKTLTNAIIGLVIVILAYVIVAVVANALRGDV